MPVYSIKTIKEYANNYISNNGREITKTVLLITSAVIFVQAVNFFSQVLGLILGLITLTMPQGLVYASLKIVDQQELSAIDEENNLSVLTTLDDGFKDGAEVG